jgi:hypothetical protein
MNLKDVPSGPSAAATEIHSWIGGSPILEDSLKDWLAANGIRARNVTVLRSRNGKEATFPDLLLECNVQEVRDLILKALS